MRAGMDVVTDDSVPSELFTKPRDGPKINRYL